MKCKFPEVEQALCSFRQQGSYAGGMATRFIQQSTEYIQQIEAEIERLQQLRDQVGATIQSEVPEQESPRKRAAKKSAEKRVAGKRVPAKKRGRRKAEAAEA